MRVNGLKLKTGRVFGAFVLILNLCFLAGFLTANYLVSPNTIATYSFFQIEVQSIESNLQGSEALVVEGAKDLTIKGSEKVPSKLEDLRCDFYWAAKEEDLLAAKQEIVRLITEHERRKRDIEESGNPHDALVKRGQFYLSLSLFERARRDFEKALEYENDSFEAYLGRGRAYLGLGDLEAAEEDFDEAIDLDASRAAGYLERSRLFQAKDELKKALLNLEVAHVREPKNETVVFELAQVFEQDNQFQESRRCYQQVKDSEDPTRRTLARLGLQRIAEITGQQWNLFHDQIDTEELLSLQAEFECQRSLDRLFHKYTPSMQTILDCLRRDLAVRNHFKAWRLAQPAQLSNLERLYKKVLFYSAVTLFEADWSKKSENFYLNELQRTFPDSPEVALAQALINGTALSFESFETRLEQSSCVSAREYRRSRDIFDPSDDPGEVSRDLLAKRRMALSRILLLNPWNYQARFQRAKSCDHRQHHLYLYNCNHDLHQVLVAKADHWPAVLLLTQNVLCNRSELSLKEAKSLLDRLVDGVRRSSQLSRNEKDSLFARAYFQRAQVYKAQGQSESMIFADARGALFHLNGDTPKSLRQMIEIHQWLADEFQFAGDKEQSIAHVALVEECRKLAKARSLSAFEEGMKERERRCYNEAIEHFNTALAYDPQRINARTERAVCYFKIGHFIAGIVDMAKAVELDHREHRNFFKKIYYMNYAIDLKRVIDEINKLVEAKPHLAHIHYLKGFFYVAMTDFKEYDANVIRIGKASFAKALEINPHFVSAHVLRADLLIKEGKMDDAHKDLDKALKLAPDSWDAYYWKAVACGAQRRAGLPAYKVATTVALGKSYLTKAMKNYPGFAERVFKEPSLDGLFANDKEQRRFIESFGLLDDE